MKTQQTEIDSLKKGHIEKGFAECGSSGKWSSENPDWPKMLITIPFSRPYASPPETISSIRDYGTVTKGDYIRIGAFVSQVNTTHITVKCYKHRDDNYIFSFSVNWIAFSH